MRLDEANDGQATRIIVKSGEKGTRMRRRGESGCYCLPVMRLGEGVFIRRDKYSMHEVSSRENKERNK